MDNHIPTPGAPYRTWADITAHADPDFVRRIRARLAELVEQVMREREATP